MFLTSYVHRHEDYIVHAALFDMFFMHLGTAVAQWLRRYATNREVAGSIPDGVIGIFQ